MAELKYTFNSPVEVEGVTYEELVGHTPKGRDIRKMFNFKGGGGDRLQTLMSTCFEKEFEFFDELPAEDWAQLSEMMSAFLPSSPQETNS